MAKLVTEVPNTSFQRRMAEGHYSRTGHKLDAVQVSDDGILWHTIRECCGEEIPETVAVW